jgi:hypothetical protein
VQSTDSFVLEFYERVSGTVLQDVTMTISSVGLANTQELFFGFMYNIEDSQFEFVFNGTKYTQAIDPLTLTGDSETNTISVQANNTNATNFAYIDDLLITANNSASIDIFIDHYLKEIAWNTTHTYSDILLKPAANGKVRTAGRLSIDDSSDYNGIGSVGTLHLFPEDDMPASTQGGDSTTYYDMDWSDYVPFGVKALYFQYYGFWIGDGTTDSATWYLISGDASTTTSNTNALMILSQYTNLASGVTLVCPGFVTAPCSKTGVVRYKVVTSAATSGISIKLKGFYI